MCHLVHGQAGGHSLDQLLDERRCLWTHDVGTQKQAGVGVGQDLGETGGVLHGPSIGRLRVAAGRHDVGAPGVDEFLLGVSDAADLGVAEDGVRHEASVDATELPRVGEVVGDDPCFGIRCVLELSWVGYVAKGPDPVGTGTEVFVRGDVPLIVQVDSSPVDLEEVPIGLSTGGHQQLIGLQAGPVGEADVVCAVVGHL